MWTGLPSASVLGLAIERDLGEVAIGQRPAFDRGEGGVLLAQAVQRLLDFFIGHGDFRLLGAQLLVAFDLDLGHHFEAGLEAQRLVVVQVEVGDLRLRHRDQTLLVGLLAEVARDQGLDHVALQVFGKALPDDGGGHMSAAEAGEARQLLILLDQGIRSRGLLPRRESQPAISRLVLLLVSVGLTFAFQALAVRTVPFRNRG